MITRLHYRRSEPNGGNAPLNRFGRMYPWSLCTSRHLEALSDMMWRRRIGIAMMVFFLPVNAPLFILATEALEWNVDQPDWLIGLSFLILFFVGGVLAFMPRISIFRLFQSGDQP